jgi:hypothetical protein
LPKGKIIEAVKLRIKKWHGNPSEKPRCLKVEFFKLNVGRFCMKNHAFLTVKYYRSSSKTKAVHRFQSYAMNME